MKDIYLKNVATLKLDQNKCNGCRMCEKVCPHQVFTFVNRRAHIDALDRCMECGACMGNCEQGAILVIKGVGCAAAVISSRFGSGSACCDGKGGC